MSSSSSRGVAEEKQKEGLGPQRPSLIAERAPSSLRRRCFETKPPMLAEPAFCKRERRAEKKRKKRRFFQCLVIDSRKEKIEEVIFFFFTFIERKLKTCRPTSRLSSRG